MPAIMISAICEGLCQASAAAAIKVGMTGSGQSASGQKDVEEHDQQAMPLGYGDDVLHGLDRILIGVKWREGIK
jgi:hypothetical protein